MIIPYKVVNIGLRTLYGIITGPLSAYYSCGVGKTGLITMSRREMLVLLKRTKKDPGGGGIKWLQFQIYYPN